MSTTHHADIMCLWMTLKTTNRGVSRPTLAPKLTCRACFLSLFVCLVTQFRPRQLEFTAHLVVSNIESLDIVCDSDIYSIPSSLKY
jgi:hypothetical protein